MVTRKTGDRAYAAVDSEGRAVLGARLAGGGTGEGALHWSAQVSALRADDAIVAEPREAEEDRGFALFSLGRGGFSLDAQLVDRALDDTARPGSRPLDPMRPGSTQPGMEPEPMRPDGPGVERVLFDQTSWAVEARHRLTLGDSLVTTLRASVNDNQLALGTTSFEDRVTRLGADLSWRAGDRHDWLASVEVATSEIDRARALSPGAPTQPPRELLIDGESRDIVSLTVQDQVELAEALTLTLGARWDDYSDIGDRVTPRLSLVWQAADHHIFKAQYAEGFRAPTFFELFAPEGELNEGLDFETNATTELNYVYRRAGRVGRVTLFRTEVEDMVFPILPDFAFSNSRRASAEGVELEWSQQLTERLKMLANASASDTEDTRSSQLPGAYGEADWLSNLALLYRLRPHWLASLHWNHVGDRPATEATSAYDELDVTLSLEDLWKRGFGLRLGVANALDERIAYVVAQPDRARFAEYRGRTVWLQLSWSR